jgi:hypothetical protein
VLTAQKISASWLRARGAQPDQLATYTDVFGTAPVAITPALILRAAAVGLDVSWFAYHLLVPHARDEHSREHERAWDKCKHALAIAMAECRRVCMDAQEKRDRACDDARAVFDRACAAARDKYDREFVAARQEYECERDCAGDDAWDACEHDTARAVYNRARTSARGALSRACAAAREKYDRACESAWEECDHARANAWAEYYHTYALARAAFRRDCAEALIRIIWGSTTPDA